MAISRVDLVFSYWIYIWFLLYMFHFTTYNPKFALVIGVIDNIIMLILMIYYGSKSNTILFFIIINTFIKVLPIYYLKNEIIKMNDIYFTIGLFIVFSIWLHIHSQSLIGNVKLIHDSLLYGKNNTPLIHLFSKIEKNFKNFRVKNF
jgi:hypothetical protein